MSNRDSSRQTQADRDNRSNQLNGNNDAYWQSRGEPERPDDWQERRELESSSEKDESK